MTTQDHRREAERLLNSAKLDDWNYDTDPIATANVRAAKVHAILATAPPQITIDTDQAREAGRREAAATIKRLQRDRDQAEESGRRFGGADALLWAADELPNGTSGHVRMLLRRYADRVRSGDIVITLPDDEEETQ